MRKALTVVALAAALAPFGAVSAHAATDPCETTHTCDDSATVGGSTSTDLIAPVRYHRVRPGEWVFKIARSYYPMHAAAEARLIVRANHLTSPYVLHAGQPLRVPFL